MNDCVFILCEPVDGVTVFVDDGAADSSEDAGSAIGVELVAAFGRVDECIDAWECDKVEDDLVWWALVCMVWGIKV